MQVVAHMSFIVYFDDIMSYVDWIPTYLDSAITITKCAIYLNIFFRCADAHYVLILNSFHFCYVLCRKCVWTDMHIHFFLVVCLLYYICISRRMPFRVICSTFKYLKQPGRSDLPWLGFTKDLVESVFQRLRYHITCLFSTVTCIRMPICTDLSIVYLYERRKSRRWYIMPNVITCFLRSMMYTDRWPM